MNNNDFDLISEIRKLLKKTTYSPLDVYRCNEERKEEIASLDSIFECENDEQSLKSLALFSLMGKGSVSVRNHFARKEGIKQEISQNDINVRKTQDDNALLFISGLAYNKRFRTLAFNILHLIQYEISKDKVELDWKVVGLTASPEKSGIMRKLGGTVELSIRGISGSYTVHGSEKGIQIEFKFNEYQAIMPFYLEFHLQDGTGNDHYLQLSGKSNIANKESTLRSKLYNKITSGEKFSVIAVYPLDIM